MLLKINNLKFTNNLKHVLVLGMTLFAFNVMPAQEIIEEAKEGDQKSV